tara:strand:- start:661 stop:915 length:255 start_codon:yes stop_codon:yes gene_type:complete
MKIEYCFKTFLVSLIFGLFCGLCCVLYNSTGIRNTHIEKITEKHNSIKESVEPQYHPTIAKPDNSQDSVRVMPENYTIEYFIKD